MEHITLVLDDDDMSLICESLWESFRSATTPEGRKEFESIYNHIHGFYLKERPSADHFIVQVIPLEKPAMSSKLA